MVPRPLVLHVEHQAIDGERQITIFEKGMARLVAHEIDHLYGTLYTKRCGLEQRLSPSASMAARVNGGSTPSERVSPNACLRLQALQGAFFECPKSVPRVPSAK
jgi:hypothetical protein